MEADPPMAKITSAFQYCKGHAPCLSPFHYYDFDNSRILFLTHFWVTVVSQGIFPQEQYYD